MVSKKSQLVVAAGLSLAMCLGATPALATAPDGTAQDSAAVVELEQPAQQPQQQQPQQPEAEVPAQQPQQPEAEVPAQQPQQPAEQLTEQAQEKTAPAEEAADPKTKAPVPNQPEADQPEAEKPEAQVPAAETPAPEQPEAPAPEKANEPQVTDVAPADVTPDVAPETPPAPEATPAPTADPAAIPEVTPVVATPTAEAQADEDKATTIVDKINVYRLWSPDSDEHLYTKDFHEAVTITQERGWRYEGIGFTASKTAGKAVWRLYNTQTNLHLWTTDANERKTWLNRGGWNDEGVAWYGAGPYHLTRLYNEETGQHLYTRDANEVKVLTTQRGWTNETKAGTWDTGDATDYVPIEPRWITSTSWGEGKKQYWIQSNGSIAQNRYIQPSEGTGYGHRVFATKGYGAMLQDDVTRLDGVLVAADKDGKLISVPKAISLSVPYTNQYDEGAPMGCEPASLYMALRAKGYLQDTTFREFVNTMPYADDGNPYHGFIGSPWPGYDPSEYNGMLMGGVALWGKKYAPVEDLSGCTPGTLIAELAQENPLVVWVSPAFRPISPRQEWYGKSASTWHVVTLMGYNPEDKTFQVSDPANKKHQYWVDWDTFTDVWNVLQGAVVVR